MNKKHMGHHLTDEALDAVSGGNSDCLPDAKDESLSIEMSDAPAETMPIHPITSNSTTRVALRSKGIVILGREEK